MSTLRIEVRFDPDTYPEIYQELARLPAKRRADRVRALCMVGLDRLARGVVVEPQRSAHDIPPGGQSPGDGHQTEASSREAVNLDVVGEMSALLFTS